jgi:branched-chain amino acid transport system substrate-binding protein
LVILATTSQAASKAIPWAMKEGMLVLSPTVSNASFSGKDDLFIRINTSSEAFGTKLAATAFGLFGKRRVGIIGDSGNALYVDAVADSFKAEFSRQGGEVPFVLGFRSASGLPSGKLLAELERARADGLVAITAGNEAAMIAKQIEKAGLGLRMFLPPWPLTLDLIKNGGKAVEGAVAVSVSDMDYRAKEGRAFHAGYLAEYGEEPSFTAMFGYEAAAVLRRTLSAAGRKDPESVKRKLIELGEFPGLQGNIAFDKNGDASRDLFLFAVEDGKFKRIGE